jgi:hypothetical protein
VHLGYLDLQELDPSDNHSQKGSQTNDRTYMILASFFRIGRLN